MPTLRPGSICFPVYAAYLRVCHAHIRIFAANLAMYPAHVSNYAM